MDLQDQLKKLFPDHIPTEPEVSEDSQEALWMQDESFAV